MWIMLELEVTSMEQNCMFLISNIFPMSMPTSSLGDIEMWTAQYGHNGVLSDFARLGFHTGFFVGEGGWGGRGGTMPHRNRDL